jgi:Outer membrane protein beta-barrel domain
MKRVLLGLIALGSIAASSPAAAQRPRLSLGVGGVKPSGDYGAFDNMGWHVLGALEVGVPRSPLAVRGDVAYGQTTHQGGSLLTGNTTLSGVTANAVYHIGAPMVPVRLYVLGGAGYYRVSIDGMSETKPAFDAGTGVSLGAGPMKVFAEARFITVRTSGSATNFFPVSVGLTFGM